MREQASSNQERSAQIARLNDTFRRTTPNIFATPGIQAMPDVPSLIDAVRQFDAFTPENDPYGEHDSGLFDWQSERVFWKLDYYDQNFQYWCDPLRPECQRILTIMLASEY